MIWMGGACVYKWTVPPGKMQVGCLQPLLINQTWDLLLHVLLLSLLSVCPSSQFLGAQSGPVSGGLGKDLGAGLEQASSYCGIHPCPGVMREGCQQHRKSFPSFW